VEEARRTPNGWVYRIAPGYAPDQRVPPHAIVGAWRVDAGGEITGEFVPNPRYTPFASAAGLPGFGE
jgi:hypothetical protein